MTSKAAAILYNGKKNVLWGTGKIGIQTLFTLISFGVYVEMFCDSDREKHGLRLYNKIVEYPDSILKNSHKYNIIIAIDNSMYIQEIEDKLTEYNISEYVNWKEIGENVCSVSVRTLYLYWMIRDSYSRKLIIYGYGREGRELGNLLSMLDVEIAYFVDDIETENHDWRGWQNKPVHQLVHEKKGSFKVIVTSDKVKNISVLDKMGLVINLDYGIYSNYAKLQMPRKHIYDVNLGFNFCCDEVNDKLPGFVKSGEQGPLIVLLGNSTTDGGALYPTPSWGKILFEQLKQNGYTVTILNGGCCGYRSSQELVKLIRDVVPMKPRAVIHYTGFNDAFQTPRTPCVDQYPFAHPQQIALFDEISRKTGDFKDNWCLAQYNLQGNYTLGVTHGRTRWEMFEDNIKMMNSICKDFEISYRAFLQPCLVTKAGKFSDYEKELLWNTKILRKESFYYIEEFYKHAKEIKRNYIEDVTELFDDKDDVYLDYCHVTRTGNELIAQYMFEYLLREKIIEK